MTASPRAPCPSWAQPKADAPPLGKLLIPHSLSLRYVMVGASVSVSGRMPFSLPCLSRVFHLSVALCLPLSLCASVCVCVCVQLCVLAHVSVSSSPSLSLSLNLRLFLALCFLIPGLPSLPLPPASPRCYDSGSCWRTCVCRLSHLAWLHVSVVCLSVCLPVAHLLSQEGPALGGWRGARGSLGRAKGRG